MTKSIILVCSLILVALAFFTPPPACAATCYMNQDGTEDFIDIHTALSTVAGGGLHTIIVRDGEYTGANNQNLNFGGKAITLRSENGPEACIIDCEDAGRGFTFDHGESTSLIVDVSAIRNGRDEDGGEISCQDGSPTITNCT